MENVELEKMIDAKCLSEILGEIADICIAKAGHLRANWQDENAAKEWERAAKLMTSATGRVNV